MPINPELSDELLAKVLQDKNSGIHFLVNALIEANRQKDVEIAELYQKLEQMQKDFDCRILRLEKKNCESPDDLNRFLPALHSVTTMNCPMMIYAGL